MVRRLEKLAPLSSGEVEVLSGLTATSVQLPSGEDLVREGEPAGTVFVVLQGIAGRYKLLPNGQRQITAYMIPGDPVGLCDEGSDAAICSVATLSRCTVAQIVRGDLLDYLSSCPGVLLALRRLVAVDNAVLHEWLINVGRRTAYQRIAHLFCELLLRFRAVGESDGNGFAFPLTQQDLGDTTALSVVHVNRVLQALRGDGLVRWDRRRLEILDEERLHLVAMFNPSYLRLGAATSSRRKGNLSDERGSRLTG